jgi:predicted DNA-binding protein
MPGATTVGSKRRTGSKEPMTKQLNVRVPLDLAQRLDEAAKMLATDGSHLLRMMIAEKLPEYERRARVARGLEEKEDE